MSIDYNECAQRHVRRHCSILCPSLPLPFDRKFLIYDVNRDVHDSIAMISKSRESSNFFPFFSYWSRIGLSQYGLESYRFRRYCIGKYRGHIGFVDIVLVKYLGHIGLDEIFEKNIFKFFSEKCPFLAKKCPFFAIFGQKMAKISSFFVKFREVVQKLAFFIVLVLGRIFLANFLYRIGIDRIFGKKWLSYWYWVKIFFEIFCIVLVSDGIFGPKFFSGVLVSWLKKCQMHISASYVFCL